MELKKLRKIIKDHSLFLESSGKKGTKADLNNAELQNVDLIGANLSNANLSNADMSNANLSNADLSGAVLISADLTDADLTNADLTNAILRGADLHSADLSNANLSKADLSNVNLRNAELCGTILISTDMDNADLSSADLSNADLSNADLRNVDLIGTNLSNADLSDAYLISADFTDADLSNTILRGANLNSADLNSADLSNADLSNADLSEADLSSATLLGTIFRNTKMQSVKIDENTIFGSTIFANCDLSSIQNLRAATHLYPSTFGIDTIVKSNGIIDRIFLRNAGVQQNIVTYIDSTLYQPIDYNSCIISYSGGDEDFAKNLQAKLQAKKIRCWISQKDMKIEDKISETIRKNIFGCDKLLLILSENSVKSDWIEKEITTVTSKEMNEKSLVLFPIMLDKSINNEDTTWIEVIKKDKQIYDFTKWQNQKDFKKSFDSLLKDLELTDEE